MLTERRIPNLHNCQTHDPGRGSFLIRPRKVPGKVHGKPVFISATTPTANGFIPHPYAFLFTVK